MLSPPQKHNSMRAKALIITILAVATLTSAARQQRLIVTCDLPPLNLDPSNGRYLPRAAPQLATLADTWRTELGDQNLTLAIAPLTTPTLAKESAAPLYYKVYTTLCDTTLRSRAARELGITPLVDSLRALFAITTPMLEGIPTGGVLIVDRYTVADKSETHHKYQTLDNLSPSKRYTKAMAADELAIRNYFAAPLTTLDTAITTRDCYFGPSAFTRLLHTMQLEATGAHISLVAPPVHDATLGPGAVTVADILRLFRYDNALVRVTMSGAQLDSLLEKIYGMRYFTLRGAESDMVRTRVPYYLHDDAAGIRYRVDLAARNGQRVTIYQTERGTKFDPRGRYTVAMNSFRARELSGMPIDTVAADYRIAMIRMLGAQKLLSPRQSDNWSIGPEKWSRTIEKRERVTIFENK